MYVANIFSQAGVGSGGRQAGLGASEVLLPAVSHQVG